MKSFIHKLFFTAIFLITGLIAFGQEKNDNTDNLDSIYNQMKEDFVSSNFEFDFDFDDDNVSAQQIISGMLSSKVDVYYSQTAFSLSPARFRLRGYNNEYQKTYINGIYFNGLERGNFNFSSLGGLNYATRNKEITRGMESNGYTFGNIGTSTNINVRASAFAKGNNISLAATNRNYTGRLQYTYATGLMNNGWAFMGSAVMRYAYEGIVDGTFYKSAGYFLSAEKRFGKDHILNFSTFGAPTERAGQSAITGEVYDLINGKNPLRDGRDDNGYLKDEGYFAQMFHWNEQGRYYNPNWGWQNGKKRNSRIVHSYDPTAILNYEWKISDNQNLKAGAAFHYSMYSNSAFSKSSVGLDQRPDYYRNLPSYRLDRHFYLDLDGSQYLDFPSHLLPSYYADVELWNSQDPLTTQVNWTELYQANYNANSDITENAVYTLIRRHDNLMETSFNVNYKNVFNDKLKLTAGVEAKQSKGIHYATIDDMLGAERFFDIDAFADRDATGSSTLPKNLSADFAKNNIGGKDELYKGDKINYDYDINLTHIAAYVQNDWSFRNVELYYALQGTYTSFNRFGRMLNGRAEFLTAIAAERNPIIKEENIRREANGMEPLPLLPEVTVSKGKGATQWFIDPAFKAGVVWKINGRNIITANVLAETQAPLAYNSYISQRIKDTQVKNLVSEKVFTGDLGYNFSFPKVVGRISAFYTEIFDGVERNGYYDDDNRTFINVAMSGINKRHMGVEAGISIKLNKNFTLVAAGTYSDFSYTKDARITMSAENGSNLNDKDNILTTGEDVLKDDYLDKVDIARIKGLKIAAGPQVAASVALKYFHPKMWFADITVNYVDKNYLSIAPSRFSTENYGNGIEYDPNQWGRYGKDEEIKDVDDPSIILGYKPSAAREMLGTQERLKGGFLLDLSIGKLIYLKDRKGTVTINLSVNNILNTALITGGYQQGRIPWDGKSHSIDTNYGKYPNKYYYAYGTNFFLNIGYKF
ncbi:MAG: hypothetical protein LBS50_02170 [Prevotellaceae bacterium]|nr:hypothetical protein [Prevotellaceae bacterium]